MCNEREEYEREALAELDLENRSVNPVHAALKFTSFVSTSAGRGRKRREPVEVALVTTRLTGVTCEFDKFRFDQASESFDGEYLDMDEQAIIDTLLGG